ncbi:MAG: polysaccharide biosynthesis C-terminal domain-containing protein, partial [Beijerinckiaceae bacterium]|nr:polysaccharide biosynthesis C-terminal domain-containing protein [Beijerinckiaceae bacterium]
LRSWLWTIGRTSIHLNTGRWEQALALGERLHRLFPEENLTAGLAAFELGRKDEARWLLIAQDRQKSQLAAQVIAAAVTLIATAVFAKYFGGLGAAIGMLLGALTVWACAAAFVRSCPVRPSLRLALPPAAAATLAVLIAKWLDLSPLTGAFTCGAGMILLGMASANIRGACLYLIRAKRH